MSPVEDKFETTKTIIIKRTKMKIRTYKHPSFFSCNRIKILGTIIPIANNATKSKTAVPIVIININ